jgi:hypothetical protein
VCKLIIVNYTSLNEGACVKVLILWQGILTDALTWFWLCQFQLLIKNMMWW